LTIAPRGDDGQTLSTSGLGQSVIERHEWNRLSKLPLQVQAARKLDGVARAQRMPQEQSPRIRGSVRNHLQNRESGQVALEGVAAGRRHSGASFASREDVWRPVEIS
jgi:hypothetical protein